MRSLSSALLLTAFTLIVGCSDRRSKKADVPAPGLSDEVKAARGTLSPEDQKLVEAQEYCAVTNESRLGEMGEPLKIMVKGQPVFLCCSGCRKRALADPDKTLARVEELKAKVKAAAATK
jgi:hypothetical protein